jgi:diacylglycerol kinase
MSQRNWWSKFADAFRGLYWGTEGQSSFVVHLLVSVVVMGAAFYFRVDGFEWALLLLCITAVLVAEMFNSALEHIGKAIDSDHNPQLGKALDIASAAVLLSALGAATVGLVVFLPYFVQLLS